MNLTMAGLGAGSHALSSPGWVGNAPPNRHPANPLAAAIVPDQQVAAALLVAPINPATLGISAAPTFLTGR